MSFNPSSSWFLKNQKIYIYKKSTLLCDTINFSFKVEFEKIWVTRRLLALKRSRARLLIWYCFFAFLHLFIFFFFFQVNCMFSTKWDLRMNKSFTFFFFWVSCMFDLSLDQTYGKIMSFIFLNQFFCFVEQSLKIEVKIKFSFTLQSVGKIDSLFLRDQ